MNDPGQPSGEAFIDGLEAQFGDFPGERAIHTKGLGLRGSFCANGAGAELSKAAHLQAGDFPVVARFSNGDGNPKASDGGAFSRGFAVRFSLPDGATTDLLSIVSPIFITKEPEVFLEFIRALRPNPGDAEPSKLNVAEFALRHPVTMAHVVKQQASPVPASFATIAWHAVHVFGMENTAGDKSLIKYSWLPVAEEKTLSRSDAEARGPNYLMDDARTRVAAAPIEFDLALTLGTSNDPVDRPDHQWPDDRRRLVVGRLSLDGLEDLSSACFSPGNLTPGICPPTDEIFPARLRAYSVSQARRTK